MDWLMNPDNDTTRSRVQRRTSMNGRWRVVFLTAFILMGMLAGAWGPILPGGSGGFVGGGAAEQNLAIVGTYEMTDKRYADGWEDGDSAEYTVTKDVGTSTEVLTTRDTDSGEYALNLLTGDQNDLAIETSDELAIDSTENITLKFEWKYENASSSCCAGTFKQIQLISQGAGDNMVVIELEHDEDGVEGDRLWMFGKVNSSIELANDEWRSWRVEINQVAGTATVYNVTSSGSEKIWSVSMSKSFADNDTQKVKFYFRNDDNTNVNWHLDDVSVTSENYTPSYTVSGTVTDQNGAGLNNATITVKESGNEILNTTTSQNGEYSVSLADGTYNVTASKSGYHNITKELTVDGSDTTLDFELVEKETGLELDIPILLKHGERGDYTVYFVERNANGDLVRTDVTSTATVTSNNTSIVNVDTSTVELVATNNESINAEVVIQSNYTTNGTTYWDNETLVVANVSIKNIVILPGPYRITASFSPDSTGATDPMLAILVATLVGIVGARASSAFGGLAAMVMALIVAWFGGFVSTGIMLVAVFAGTFIGLNVAGTVRYSRGRG